MLIGQYLSKLTDKDRVSVPKKLRRELGDELIVARWYEKCLVLVSKDAWQNLVKRLTGPSYLIISPVRDLDRFIFGQGFEIKLDRQGRFIIPKVLLNYASIKSEVIFVGLGDRVEIWDSTEWDTLEKAIEEKAYEALERIAVGKKKVGD
ncbi:division/cell wall cluster transcriptional repressor MraZ [Candidatus Woesebacteria bacterium RIFCSPHIGHO2_01_FULL_38_10]|uniref:Transcriptional regulator MraZ n=1 Tax=Candidatus Woesebacteria bacterium RIFCSPLOWO2_01_FULL_39_10b TaxID=1802517 RepID=A0A1F8B7B2_9BACT|nr:MAG: division/cell wall cluster transcriptional repressor MraZ [Candidatus Woesebacteria bacterium RIFCSPHIGHO2_01_FULL_38_10]OGM59305.1 MAG: division/cell wall cluster transcriptional repressor MraZ [Candidatus Woesebacteria bacterium RIFCSPLOWO2_01_FULL_39_10b]